MSSGTFVSPAVSKRELYVIFGALMLGMLLSALDSTIVSTALPTIVGDLHGASRISWVVTGYLLATTVSTPLWGKLGDLYGRKNFFHYSIVIFVVGSMLCGLAHSMVELIIFRSLQGLGGGGLIIEAQAIIADVVSPRERGRYAGFFGAVFGAATVFGPLLGGLIVEYWSWRWIFFVNLPVGILALVVTAAVLPKTTTRVSHDIDYSGFFALAVSSAALILFTSLGGTSLAWLSAPSVALVAVGVAAAMAFVWLERRAVEPILPLKLFANRVFSSSSAIGFVVGFSMFGALTYLPVFLQLVRGVSPTASGVRLLPLMVGLFGASIASGALVSKGWRYRPFPIAGTAVMTVGLGLLGVVTEATSNLMLSVYMVVLGIGLGLVMQLLVTVVQNAVHPSDIGAATAGANFFRSIGGSFGTAVFGALYANELPRHVVADLGPSGLAQLPAKASSWTPAVIGRLPTLVRSEVVHAIAQTIQDVYRWSAPIGVLAVLLSFTLPEVALRTTRHPVADEVPLSLPDPTS